MSELFIAARDGNIKYIEEAIKNKFDINQICCSIGFSSSKTENIQIENTTLLIISAINNHVAMIELLIKSGANIHQKSTKCAKCFINEAGSALYWANRQNNTAAFKTLIQAGANIDEIYKHFSVIVEHLNGNKKLLKPDELSVEEKARRYDELMKRSAVDNLI